MTDTQLKRLDQFNRTVDAVVAMLYKEAAKLRNDLITEQDEPKKGKTVNPDVAAKAALNYLKKRNKVK